MEVENVGAAEVAEDAEDESMEEVVWWFEGGRQVWSFV